MGFEATGKLHTISDTKQVSERFSKREFVIELTDNPKYPQTVLFQLTGDRCAQLDGMQVGEMVRIDFSLRGREWRSPSGEVKYFNSLDVWKVEPAGASRGAGNNRQSRGNDDWNGGGGNRGGGGGGRGRGNDDWAAGGGGGGGRGSSNMPPRDDVPPPGDDARPRDDFGREDDLPF
ncbi:MAG TPA: DUF3127 domain-containing protein [Kofleriaceae bacterium]